MTTQVDLLFEYSALNGGERSWLATLRGLRAAGIRPRAIVPAFPPVESHPLRDELTNLGVPCRRLAFHNSEGKRRPLEEIRQDLTELIQQDRPALLHANSLAMARVAGPVCDSLGMPSVGHVRDIVKLSGQAIRDVNQCTRLLAVSVATRDHHLASGMNGERLHVCYNGVDLGAFQPVEKKSCDRVVAALKTTDRLMLSIGQISLRKGFDVIATACEALFAETPALHWAIIGQRHSDKSETVHFDQYLRERVSRAPLAGRVHFLGTHSDVHALLPHVDLLVHAARQEPLGRVLLEAAACSVPVIATDVGGTREIFCADVSAPSTSTARLVPPDDPAALAATIAWALDHPDRSRALAAEARAICRSRFDAERAASDLARHYQEVVSIR